jgi:hypothetical protein
VPTSKKTKVRRTEVLKTSPSRHLISLGNYYWKREREGRKEKGEQGSRPPNPRRRRACRRRIAEGQRLGRYGTLTHTALCSRTLAHSWMVSPRSLINLPHILAYCNSLKEVTGAVCSGDAAATLLPCNLQGEEVVRVTRNAR